MLACASLLVACGGSSGSSGGHGRIRHSRRLRANPNSGESTTSGPAYNMPGSVALVAFNEGAAQTGNECAIDTSQLAQGVVGASARSDARLKFQVVKGEMSYNYDLPGDGTPIIVPINMGDGPYTFRVMQNTSGNNYVELFSVIENVNLSSETAPFLVPNMFVNYNESSAVVAKARELAQGAANQGDVVRNIYQWVVDNITYDHDKAAHGWPRPRDDVPDARSATLASGRASASTTRRWGRPCCAASAFPAK